LGLLLKSDDPDMKPSQWVKRWSHLIPTDAKVLDVACGFGRHMQWFSRRGCYVTGIDRSPDAVQASSHFGTILHADIENGQWPLMNGQKTQTFDGVVVTNYLWRPLIPTVLASLAPGGCLIYETFSRGNETVGKPTRRDYLLETGELLKICQNLRVIAFEEGFLPNPEHFVQRIVAVNAPATLETCPRYPLSLE
jgi:SAM-dependent methyltransferase